MACQFIPACTRPTAELVDGRELCRDHALLVYLERDRQGLRQLLTECLPWLPEPLARRVRMRLSVLQHYTPR